MNTADSSLPTPEEKTDRRQCTLIMVVHVCNWVMQVETWTSLLNSKCIAELRMGGIRILQNSGLGPSWVPKFVPSFIKLLRTSCIHVVLSVKQFKHLHSKFRSSKHYCLKCWLRSSPKTPQTSKIFLTVPGNAWISMLLTAALLTAKRCQWYG